MILQFKKKDTNTIPTHVYNRLTYGQERSLASLYNIPTNNNPFKNIANWKPILNNTNPHWFDRNLDSLKRDLPFIEIAYKEGIIGINNALSTIFNDFKTTTTPETMDKKIKELNLFCQRAIYSFPHLANSIELELENGFIGNDPNSRIHNDHRWVFKHINVKNNILRFNLPHLSTINNGSYEGITFNRIRNTNGRFEKIIECQLSAEKTILSLSEVKKIRFSQSSEITPIVNRFNNDLISRPHPLLHYILSRDFITLSAILDPSIINDFQSSYSVDIGKIFIPHYSLHRFPEFSSENGVLFNSKNNTLHTVHIPQNNTPNTIEDPIFRNQKAYSPMLMAVLNNIPITINRNFQKGGG